MLIFFFGDGPTAASRLEFPVDLSAMLKGELHASYRGIGRLYQDAFGLPVSTGYLAKVVDQASDALASPYESLCSALAVGRKPVKLAFLAIPRRLVPLPAA